MNVSVLFIFLISCITFCVEVNAGKIFEKKINGRIVNGDEVSPHSLPYMAAIHTIINDITILCGGSLISDSLVLTAARCLSGATEAEVILGAHNIDEAEDTQIELISTEFIIHEEYEDGSNDHNIAIIKLPSAVTLNENIALITLPNTSTIKSNYDDELGLVAGWGKAKDIDATSSSVLRYIEVTIIPSIICELPYVLTLSTDKMCTTGVEEKNICLGDSGSPLLVDGVQVAIAAYGSDFGCEAGFPGVYTKISTYLRWILEKIDTYGEKS